MVQTTRKKTNTKWYPYEEHGCFYKLEDDVLLYCPMNSDGTRDENVCEVDWERGVYDAEDRERMNAIVAELKEME